MQDYKRKYEVHILLGKPDGDPLWIRKRWLKVIVPFVDSLLPCVRKPLSVCTTQFGSDNKAVTFPRLGWNKDSHAKWTLVSGKERLFVSTEIKSAQTRTTPPDLFVGLRNERHDPDDELLFNPLVLVALAVDLNVEPSLAS